MIKLTAHIPTEQYGFLEVSGDLSDQSEVERLYNHYAGEPRNFSPAPQSDRKEIKAFVGGSIFYSSATHTYTNKEGEVYLSGSKYADKFKKPFNKDAISAKMAKNADCSQQEILDMWELNGFASRTFGTAIHSAMELYGKYKDLADKLGKESHISNTVMLSDPVRSFYKTRADEKAEHEIFVVDHATKRAGQIDRLLVTGNKTGRVGDFKTNGEVLTHLPEYYAQLSFYAHILQAGGWTIEGLDVFHWNGSEWTVHSSPVLELK